MNPADEAGSGPANTESDFATMTPEVARAGIAEMRTAALEDPTHAYNDPGHHGHHAANERMANLYRVAYPGAVSSDGFAVAPEDEDGSAIGEFDTDIDLTEPRRERSDFKGVLEKTFVNPADDLDHHHAARLVMSHWMANAKFTLGDAETFVGRYNEIFRDLESRKAVLDKDWAPETKTSVEAKCRADLDALWGNAAEKNIQIATRAIARINDSSLDALIEHTGLGADPYIVRLFFEVGRRNGW